MMLAVRITPDGYVPAPTVALVRGVLGEITIERILAPEVTENEALLGLLLDTITGRKERGEVSPEETGSILAGFVALVEREDAAIEELERFYLPPPDTKKDVCLRDIDVEYYHAVAATQDIETADRVYSTRSRFAMRLYLKLRGAVAGATPLLGENEEWLPEDE